jgi:hypothetical protein
MYAPAAIPIAPRKPLREHFIFMPDSQSSRRVFSKMEGEFCGLARQSHTDHAFMLTHGVT